MDFKKKRGFFRKENYLRSETFTKAESMEIIVPKLNLAPISKYHKWNKQILKQIKKEYGPIHDSNEEERTPISQKNQSSLFLPLLRIYFGKFKSRPRQNLLDLFQYQLREGFHFSHQILQVCKWTHLQMSKVRNKRSKDQRLGRAIMMIRSPAWISSLFLSCFTVETVIYRTFDK